jgi:hypothetical protein
MAIKAPTLAALAPGVDVSGRMVSPTSFKKAVVSGDDRSSVLTLLPDLQPDIKSSAPIMLPPSNKPTLLIASLLFILLIIELVNW